MDEINRTPGMPPDSLLRLLYLVDMADSLANNRKARKAYIEQISQIRAEENERDTQFVSNRHG
jgi:hypothetical protein